MSEIIDLTTGNFGYGFSDDYKQGYSDGRASIVTELEKIRAEITACTQQEEGEVPACINYGIKLSTEIVEKHIAELKGENNGRI